MEFARNLERPGLAAVWLQRGAGAEGGLWQFGNRISPAWSMYRAKMLTAWFAILPFSAIGGFLARDNSVDLAADC